MLDDHFEASLNERQAHNGTITRGGQARVTIDTLPDIVLLEIFEFYIYKEAWHTLVHVCRKWRIIVFDSPRRLDLQLKCIISTPVRKTLDVWPPLPIELEVFCFEKPKWGMDNIVAALEHKDRISEVNVDVSFFPSCNFEELLEAMQRPFPALKILNISSISTIVPVIPAAFLGGSAPSLQDLYLSGIPLPELPNLLLSATHLVHLSLWEIPDSGYFLPEALAAGLSMSTRLQSLNISFESPRPRSGLKSRFLPPQTRTLLPVLTLLRLRGTNEYLEDLVARIDTPLLNEFCISFFHDEILDISQVTQFIRRRTPKLKTDGEARVIFSHWNVSVILPQILLGNINFGISSSCPDEQISSLARLCGSSLGRALVPTVERLYILPLEDTPLGWENIIENSQWLDLFRSFSSVKSLYVSQEFVSCIAPVLQELVGERATEVLAALQSLYLEGTLTLTPVQETIGKFVAARQLSSHPIAVSHWERKRF